ncbi:MAG: bifunctional DNA-formamidopyrimidine glycosylase/DNA-(apurinic or apyrimidinic site) lyase [PVC group bacterium]
MPELPEVETIRRELLPHLRGKIIRRVIIPPDPKGCRLLRRYSSREGFIRRLTGRKIINVERRAKYLLFRLDGDRILIVHLGMSGQLLLGAPRRKISPHTRLILQLAGAVRLCFVDPRKFGEAYLFSEQDGDRRVNPFSLGPEPLSRGYRPAVLEESLRGRRGPVKTALLDQQVIAGLGNIYTDEALFRARIHPRRKSSGLTGKEIDRLFRSIREVLKEAIRLQGTSAADRRYVTASGEPGRFQSRLNVYQRKGEPCPCCGTPIGTEKIAGRTAHFCPRCQKQ